MVSYKGIGGETEDIGMERSGRDGEYVRKEGRY